MPDATGPPPIFIDEMTDQEILNKVNTLGKTVEAADTRTLRLGERVEKLKDSVQTDLVPKVAKIEGRTDMLVWIVGIALSIYMTLFIGGGIQLYLLNGRVSAIERDVANISKGIEELRLRKASENVTSPESVREVKQILMEAKTEKLQLSAEVVTTNGKRFVDAAQVSLASWEAALAFVDYRSFLNINFSPSVADSEPAAGICRFSGQSHIIVRAGESLDEVAMSQTFSLVGKTQDSNAARFEEIDKPTKGCGFQFIVFQMPRPDNKLSLDGMYLKNVIVKNTRVTYQGGEVKLDNVYFVNCTFDFPLAPTPKPQLRDLVAALLDSPSITFSRPS